MNVLLDTHVLIWSLQDEPEITKEFRDIISSSESVVFFSTASVWEMAVKHTKHPDKAPYSGAELYDISIRSGFMPLDISYKHIIATESLRVKEGATVNGDPFDRMLIAQAKTENMVLLTHDSVMEYYDELCIKVDN